MDVRKIGKVLMILTVFFGFAFATTGVVEKPSVLTDAICSIYKLIKDILPLFGFVLFVLAGVAYAAGQFFGAEMRGRSMGWAMNMVVGAIIAMVLVVIGPIILKVFYPSPPSGTGGCAGITW